MDKEFLDSFYNMIKKDRKFDIFSISFPMHLITKELFNKTGKAIKDNYDLLNADTDVLAVLYYVGGILKNQEYALTPTQLYDNLVFSSGGMTKVLKKLEERELIKREFLVSDKRKSLVCLTKKGIALIEKIMEMKMLMSKEFFSILNENDKENLKNIFSKILYSID